jgi:Flp pilus assembly protein TadG
VTLNTSSIDDPESGAITAEFATALPAVMMIGIALVAIGAAFTTQFRVHDAARVGARLTALGKDSYTVKNEVAAIARGNASVVITGSQNWVTVNVFRGFDVGPAWLPAVGLSSSATAWVEP